MLDKLEEINSRFEKLTDELGKPEVVQDQNRYRKLTQEHSSLQEIVESYKFTLKFSNKLKITVSYLRTRMKILKYAKWQFRRFMN